MTPTVPRSLDTGRRSAKWLSGRRGRVDVGEQPSPVGEAPDRRPTWVTAPPRRRRNLPPVGPATGHTSVGQTPGVPPDLGFRLGAHSTSDDSADPHRLGAGP